ncbi:MAG TPA: outer membrane beta-barrel domain-containing protein [Myxococcota bacterium]|nr:outer membrane beta-barrel domain-containing protein [Myxococcota bacterium]
MKLIAVILASLLAAAPTARADDAQPPPLDPVAQSGPDESEPDDSDIDDILAPDDQSSTVGEEKREMRAGTEDATAPKQVEIPPPRRKVIKVLQPKTFLKLGRFEFMPHIGGVTNDPFIRRVMFGGAIAYHPTEIFGIELMGGFSPNLGDADHKAVTKQILSANQVSPEISRMMAYGLLNLNFSPFYGKVAVFGRNSIIFDFYGTFGTGIVYTVDDLEVTQQTLDQKALATERQVHPALSFGGGVRVMFGRVGGIRFEVRDISYIGVLQATQLELKNNLSLMAGASLFFGRRVE